MKKQQKTTLMKRLWPLALVFGISLTLMGCPTSEYDAGWAAGFAEDDKYWEGYDDSWFTVDGGTIYYSGDLIPEYTDGSYDAGYYDGLWWAYNDGYFVAYDDAFTIGFSEGYDAAYYPDYVEFLLADEHFEWLDGGFTDGYNDGFSEGRILGAADYRDARTYDWLDAMLWYREPNDEYIDEAGVGTGEYGPVILYEYGQKPHELVEGAVKSATLRGGPGETRSIRGQAGAKQEDDGLSYRAFPTDVQQRLSVRPARSQRGNYELQIESTWLERVQAFRAAIDAGKKSSALRNDLDTKTIVLK